MSEKHMRSAMLRRHLDSRAIRLFCPSPLPSSLIKIAQCGMGCYRRLVSGDRLLEGVLCLLQVLMHEVNGPESEPCPQVIRSKLQGSADCCKRLNELSLHSSDLAQEQMPLHLSGVLLQHPLGFFPRPRQIVVQQI